MTTEAMVATRRKVGALCGDFGGRNKRGEPCGKQAIAGTKRCDMHAGIRREVARARGQINLEVRQWMLDGHSSQGVNSAEILLRLIAFWSWKVNEVGRMLGEAVVAAERLRVAHEAQQLLIDPGGGEVPESPALQTARADLERIFNTGSVSALIGWRFDADRNGQVYAVDEGIRGLARLDGEYSDRLARYCALAETAKIAEAHVRLAERQGELLIGAIRGILDDLSLSDEQAALVASVVPQHLRALLSGPVVIEGSVSDR